MNVGLCTISAKERDPEAVFDVAAAAGADGVELWGEDHVGDGGAETCETLAAAADERGLSLPVYGSYLRPGADEFEGEWRRELRVADDLGASLLRVWAGDREYGDCPADQWEAVVADLRTLAGAAAGRGVGVTVERHAGTVTNATAGAAELVDDVDAPNCGLNWQPLFSHDAGTVRGDAERLADRANNVHLQAVAEPGASDRCALADAYFDVAGVVEAFRAAGFEGYLEVEFVTDRAPYAAAVAADVAFLRTLVD